MPCAPSRSPTIAVIGGGPSGLAAAEALAAAGARVTVYDRMPSVGRKLLIAGRGGLNITHSEPFERFATRYGDAAARLRPALDAFAPDALRAWADGLGQPTVVGSSGRVFPQAWKASPLLRAWLRRLDGLGVAFALRHLWTGFAGDGVLSFRTPDGEAVAVSPDAVVLALGGASWPRLGSDGAWQPLLADAGVATSPLRPANMALHLRWSAVFRDRFAGEPMKRAAFSFGALRVPGEAVVTEAGLEGGAVYAISGPLRDALAAGRDPTVLVDLRPDLSAEVLTAALTAPRGKASLSTFLRKTTGLAPVAIGLLREGVGGPELPARPAALAALIKALPLLVTGTGGLDRAISSAGGVPFGELDGALMLRRHPGVFVAGEMLDWEAPTGGYLLQACFATGIAAARGALAWTGAGGSLSRAGSASPPRNP